MKQKTTYEQFEASPEKRRLLRQEELILDVTEAFVEALERTNTTRTQLAHNLSKTKSFVSQLFNSGRNLTLRTMADVADALGYRVRITLEAKTTMHVRDWESLDLPTVGEKARKELSDAKAKENEKYKDLLAAIEKAKQDNYLHRSFGNSMYHLRTIIAAANAIKEGGK